MPSLLHRALPLAAIAVLSLTRTTDAQTAGGDPAARGLDVFVHAPADGAPGGTLPVDLSAVGFPSVVALKPLAGATVEALWNPETLGQVASAPPSVKVVTDGDGRAHLDVPIPDGDEADLELLLGVRSGPHARTRTLKVHRARSIAAEVFVPDRRVVPGSTISAWVLAVDPATGMPAPGVPVTMTLYEGGVPRFEASLVSDAAGNAMARVPIPVSDEPSWSWTLEGRAFARGAKRSAAATVILTPREETPGKPSLSARWAKPTVLAGDRAEWSLVVRDASDQPVADLPVRYWLGPKGTRPPAEDERWIAASTRAMTDGGGHVRGVTDTPSTVVRGGTTMALVVKTNVDGHDLSAETSLGVGMGTASAALLPEARDLVPGLAQRLLLRVADGHGRPVSAPFLIEGDSLREEVRTGAEGEASITWNVPSDVGAARQVGPCAGGVAASVRVRPTTDVPGLDPGRGPFELCLPVDREAAGIVRADRSAARVGETVHVSIAAAQPSREAKDRIPARGPWSVLIRSQNGLGAVSGWAEDGEKGVDLKLPAALEGAWTISAAMPSARRAARVLGSSILVTPRELPKLAAAVTGGRAAPGGAVDVEATLTDEQGRPLAGSIAAVMIDARGGGTVGGLLGLDTRGALCGLIGLWDARCDRGVEGDPRFDLLRRVELVARHKDALGPVIDPGANAGEKLRRAFASVLLSLEGAVRDASHHPDQLRDVRRKAARGWQWNPELMTLVTAAMNEPPETPGGEPLTLTDLVAIDPQVTFDNVARRISRAKLFRVLVAVREFRHEHLLDPDEPSLKNPNAILRRLVRDGKIGDTDLVDPWGGTIQFTPSSGPSLPFLGVIKGYELHAPGPDGVVGSGDDVKDPFERVLKSRTPYAEAVQEDRMVDARHDMEVGDATVHAWSQLFTSLFGNTVGEAFGAGGLGLSGVGSGGGGRGEGIGLGSIGTIGHGRGTFGVDDGVAFWSAPLRTDPQGKVKLRVPLRDYETTWRLALVGFPDGGTPATTSLDIPVSLPLSARVDAGAVWTEGDDAAVAITVRNRTAHAVRAEVLIAATGAVQASEPGPAGEPLRRQIQIAAEGAAVVRARFKATRVGGAQLDVRLRAADREDLVTHRWEVRAPGEPTDFTSARWIEDDAELSLTLPPQSIRLVGEPRLVIERGWEDLLAGALASLDPDTQTSPRALADAVETAGRVHRWALTRGGEQSPLATRAADVSRRAVGRLGVYAALVKGDAAISLARAIPHAPLPHAGALGKTSPCPAEGATLDDRLEIADAEPAAANGATVPCWDAFVENTADTVRTTGDAEELARLLLVVIERPHRRVLAESLTDLLRVKVALQRSGRITVPDALASSRAARATLFAALLRSLRLGKKPAADADRLTAWIGVQRDGQGSYGSSLATRMVVRALLAEGPGEGEPTRVRVRAEGVERDLDVAPTARIELPLPAQTTRVSIKVKGPGVVARFERPVLRLWSHPPSNAASPLRLEATWPDKAKAGGTGTLRLSLSHTLGRAVVADLTVPLPPGATLAEPINGVRQVQGVLTIRRGLGNTDSATVIELPLRFALGGVLVVPEARARVAYEEMPRAVAPTRPLAITLP